MAKNAIESEFRTSNMADRSEMARMQSKVIFAEKNNKILYRSDMARIAIESEYQTSKMADGGHFVKKNLNLNSVLI